MLRIAVVVILFLPCAVTITAWVASHRMGRKLTWNSAEPIPGQPTRLMVRTRSVASSRGVVAVEVTGASVGHVDAAQATGELARINAEKAKVIRFTPIAPEFSTYTATNFVAWRYAWRFQGGTLFERWVVVPSWAIAPASLLPLAMWRLRAALRARRQRRRVETGCCARGYDLRGTRDAADRCPECGAAAPARWLAQQPASATVGNTPD